MRDYLYDLITDRADRAMGFFADILKIPLFLFSQIYALYVRIHTLAYEYKLLKPAKVDADVISIGNITWGGTGKTSMVHLLANYLSSQGRKVAILSRGYGKNPNIKIPASPAGRQNSKLEEYKLMGDEAYLLKEKNPNITVLVGRDRIRNAKRAVRELGCDCILLDDGFQHRRIKRDLDIVLIDVLNPFGNGHCIPRGILREPISSLKRADIIVLTNCTFEKERQQSLSLEISSINPRAKVYYASYQFKRLLDIKTKEAIDARLLIGKPIALLASIGNFLSFKRCVDIFIGAKIVCEFDFPDHYQYKLEDIIDIKNRSLEQSIETIITTEKDAVRLESRLISFAELNVVVFQVDLEVLKDSDKFFKAVSDACTD